MDLVKGCWNETLEHGEIRAVEGVNFGATGYEEDIGVVLLGDC